MSTPRLPDPIGSVPPEPGTLAAVLATARRRRARRLQAVGGTASVLLLTAALAVSLGDGDVGGRHSIGVTDDGATVGGPDDDAADDHSGTPSPHEPSAGSTPGHDPEPSHTPDASHPPDPHHTPSAHPSQPTGDRTPPPHPTGSPSGGATPTPHPTKSSYPSRTPQPTHPTHPSSPTPDPTPTGQPSQDARGEMRRAYHEGATQCGAAQWCGAAHGGAGQTGPIDFFVRACRDVDAGPGQLETGPPGADFGVSQGGHLLWQWSTGQAFPAVLVMIDVQPGDCVEWSTTWNGVDDYNRPLPDGAYEVKARVTAHEQMPDAFGFSVRLA